MFMQGENTLLPGDMDILETYDLEQGKNLLDKFSAVFDTSAEVCELIFTQFCSSKNDF